MKRLLLSAAIVSMSAHALAAGLPEALKHLESITEERAAVDAMRDYQVLQDGLIDWDSDLANQYSEGDEAALAESKAQDIRARLDALAAGWLYLLERYPQNPRVNNYYGEYLYDHTRDQAEAVRFWLQSIALDPAFGPGHNNLGVHYLHTGGVQMGLQHLHTAIELAPDNPDYLFNIVQAYLNYRREVQRWYGLDEDKVYAAAMKFSAHAAAMAPDDLDLVQDYAVNFFAAENFDVEADWKAAAEAWDRVLALPLAPVQRHFGLLNKARVMIRMGNLEAAIPLLEESLTLEPGSEAAANLLTQCRGELEAGTQKKKKKKNEQVDVFDE